ncbi:MAG: acyl-CoA thioesterase [Flavobacteriales bacterium]|nr:acyl-CoA thioesterase [Flavobacteriales bacterium]
MYSSEVEIRVRYSETDKMGYVYYGNYAQYFEVGRVEALRNLGLPYKELEESGILMPVVSFNIKYLKPAFYDDVLIITTRIVKMPSVKIHFEYETRNEKGDKLNFAETDLIFINEAKNKPCRPPEVFLNSINNFF